MVKLVDPNIVTIYWLRWSKLHFYLRLTSQVSLLIKQSDLAPGHLPSYSDLLSAGLARRPCLCGPGPWAMPMRPCGLSTRVFCCFLKPNATCDSALHRKWSVGRPPAIVSSRKPPSRTPRALRAAMRMAGLVDVALVLPCASGRPCCFLMPRAP